jgi:anti-sigma factor RsiW
MNCTELAIYIESYADGELDVVTSARIEDHLQNCAACQHALDQLGALRTLVKHGATYYRAPDRLSNLARKHVAPREDRASRAGDWWRWLRPVALVAATAAITWTAALYVHGPSKNEALVSEIVASHARSALTEHITNVASSERHVVKPWLTSKLDFSPPVMDLTGEGFPLVGARLDYVDARSVSVLVYRRRQHVINLYIWPATAEEDTAPFQTLTKRGYQIVSWAGGGMLFWAISDLNAKEMKVFAEHFMSMAK